MNNWKMSLVGGIATTLLLVACGGSESVKKEPAASVAKVMPAVVPVASGGRFTGAAQAHNRIRNQHNLAPMKWSASLASYAQEWASQLASANNCQMKHRPNSGAFKQRYGENLYWASPTTWSDGRKEVQPVTVHDVVNAWASEVKDYNYANNSCKPGKQCGHYTQIVWKSSTEVGCGYAQCSDKGQLWVCNYSPAGNYVGQKPY